MLTDFFHLNNAGSAHVISTAAAFDHMFQNCNDLVNAKAMAIKFPQHTKTFQGKRFINVNFSKSAWLEATVKDCHFEDCIFVGCEFDEVEFHRCRFINCNLYKADFFGVYLDSRSFHFDRGLRRKYSNVMLGFYQSLYANLQDAHQWKFAMHADIQRRRWDRYQMAYRIRTWKAATGREFLGSVWDQMLQIRSYLASLTYDIISRYGYGPLRFLAASAGVIAATAAYVRANWTDFGFQDAAASFPEALFYVSTVVSTLGYSDYVPSTRFGLYFSAFMGLVGVAWTGVFIALLIRRFVR